MKTLIRQHLTELQNTLSQHNLWESQAPSAAALSSDEPFCVSTLSPSQWLQWVFIPRMHALLDANASLPTGFAITPYLEEALANEAYLADLHRVVLKIETTLKG